MFTQTLPGAHCQGHIWEGGGASYKPWAVRDFVPASWLTAIPHTAHPTCAHSPTSLARVYRDEPATDGRACARSILIILEKQPRMRVLVAEAEGGHGWDTASWPAGISQLIKSEPRRDSAYPTSPSGP